jgi:hypothetical protein
MFAVAVTCGHPPDAAMVFVTVYVPAVLPDKFTNPVVELTVKPTVDVNTPALPPPLKVGEGLDAVWQ